jgi:N-ethylmaleimide reductase
VSHPENSDLPERLKAGVELNQPNPVIFYTAGAKGYTDDPFMKN